MWPRTGFMSDIFCVTVWHSETCHSDPVEMKNDSNLAALDIQSTSKYAHTWMGCQQFL